MTSRLILFRYVDMKTCLHIILPAFALVLASCSPHIYTSYRDVEVRKPSRSGMDLTGKSVAFVFPSGLDSLETAMYASLADAFASRLDEAYPESDSVRVFTLPYSQSYRSNFEADSLVNFVLDADCDLLFMLGRPGQFGQSGYKQGECMIPMVTYDALSADDNPVRHFTIAANAGPEPSKSGELVGVRISQSFLPEWQSEVISFFYTEESSWMDAAGDATLMKWQDAMRKWIALLEKETDLNRRACLEYNMGVACMMTGRPDLAVSWLEQSISEDSTEEARAALSKARAMLK